MSRYLKHCSALTIPGVCIYNRCYGYTIIILNPDPARVLKASFTPTPSVSILESVVDAKSWMQSVIPSLHDHLKAHQFKFQRNERDECRMYYKEWSVDDFWLPQGGLCLLPEGSH